MNTNEIRFKCLPANRSPHNYKWTYRKWHTISGPLKICSNGFHCSSNFVDALDYVFPGTLAIVQVSGNVIAARDKECWEHMRIIKWRQLTEINNAEIALFCANDALPIWECYSDDPRPRAAIEAGLRWVRNPTREGRKKWNAARAAAWDAARAAAWDAARAAAWAAAGDAAWDAARAAAWAAEWPAAGAAAGDAAWDLAWAAARAAARDRYHQHILNVMGWGEYRAVERI